MYLKYYFFLFLHNFSRYDLLAGLTNKLENNIPLQQLVPQIIETLKSEEGINVRIQKLKFFYKV